MRSLMASRAVTMITGSWRPLWREPAQDFLAIGLGQAKIEQRHIIGLDLRGFDRGLAVGDPVHRIGRILQCLRYGGPDHAVILDEQNAHWLSRCRHRPCHRPGLEKWPISVDLSIDPYMPQSLSIPLALSKPTFLHVET